MYVFRKSVSYHGAGLKMANFWFSYLYYCPDTGAVLDAMTGSDVLKFHPLTNLYVAYAPQLGSRLHLTHTQLNIIALAGNSEYFSGESIRYFTQMSILSGRIRHWSNMGKDRRSSRASHISPRRLCVTSCWVSWYPTVIRLRHCRILDGPFCSDNL